VAENSPQLRASENFQQLQGELTQTEDRIAVARQVYNDTIQTYNTAVETVPANLVAGAFSFSRKPFFELDDRAAREAPRVAF
jgi:LemA protein